MVKLGFIVEGATEKIILELSDFFNYLDTLPIQYIPDVIDAKGNNNLLPLYITQYSQILADKGATKIIVLTDLDNDECITNTRLRIQPLANHVVIISVKEIEAWFLADIEAMRTFLNDANFNFDNPEEVDHPYNEINSLRINRIKKGIGSKVILANAMIRSDFSIQRAAANPQCNSARYFLNKIAELSEED